MNAPFQLTELVEPEDELHETVAKTLTMLVMPPAMWTCFPAGNIPLPPRWSAKLARFGLKRGWPDLLVLHAGRIFGIELKRRGAPLSRSYMARTKRGSLRWREGQREVFPRLATAGMGIAVCHTSDEVLAALEAWGVPLRGRIAA